MFVLWKNQQKNKNLSPTFIIHIIAQTDIDIFNTSDLQEYELPIAVTKLAIYQ